MDVPGHGDRCGAIEQEVPTEAGLREFRQVRKGHVLRHPVIESDGGEQVLNGRTHRQGEENGSNPEQQQRPDVPENEAPDEDGGDGKERAPVNAEGHDVDQCAPICHPGGSSWQAGPGGRPARSGGR